MSLDNSQQLNLNALKISGSNRSDAVRVRNGGVVLESTLSVNGLQTYSDSYQGSATGSTLALGTLDTTGGAQTISAAELIGGYTYTGAAGGAVALTFPGADAVQTALAAKGVTSAAGLRLPPVIVEVTDANNLTVTAGTGETVHGTAAINDGTAVVYYVFTAAATANIYVVQDA